MQLTPSNADDPRIVVHDRIARGPTFLACQRAPNSQDALMILDEVERAVAAVPAAEGYLEVATERGARTYLLGPRTQVDARMLDWRTAPTQTVEARTGDLAAAR